jgi:hypothetical protein
MHLVTKASYFSSTGHVIWKNPTFLSGRTQSTGLHLRILPIQASYSWNPEHSWSRIFHDQGVEVRLLSEYVEAVSKLLDRQKFWNRSRKQRLLKRPRETTTNNAWIINEAASGLVFANHKYSNRQKLGLRHETDS